MLKFLKWFLVVIALVIGGMVGAYYLAKKYEEPVRNYIVREVNKRLNAPVHVSDINFSLMERFPAASLVMDSVWAEESIVKIGAPDTLFFFRKVYLNLNLFDIINGQYKINEIETRDGFMRLKVDESGYDNFHIWKQSKDTTGFLLELDKVHIESTDFSYQNLNRDQDIYLTARDLYFQGTFSEDNYTMSVDGDGLVHHFNIKGTDYIRNRLIGVESALDIDAQSERYTFRKGRLLVDEQLDFEVSGVLESDGIDLHIIGHDLDIIRSISLLPMESRNALEAYSSSGILDFDCTLKGAFGKTENPEMNVTFEVRDGAITKKGSKWKLSKLVGKGSVTNGPGKSMRTTFIRFESLNGRFNQDEFRASFTLQNLVQPTIDGEAIFETDIAALDEFFELDWIAQGSGRLSIDAKLKTTLANPDQPQARDFLNASASGSIRIEDAKIKLANDERSYRIDTAQFAIRNNDLIIDQYEGLVNDCRVNLKGRADNFLGYLFSEGEKLNVNGSIKTSTIDLQALFPTRDTESDDGSVVVAFPKRANWKLQVVADAFVDGSFVASEVSGVLIMNEFKAEANSLHFVSQGGNVSGSAGIFRFSDNQFGVKTNFSAKHVDVKELFETFKNFDQQFVEARHLSGRADAEVQFRSLCDSLMNIDYESIVANIDLSISNGALTGFEPLVSVADEIRQKPMLRLFVATDELQKRLQTVRFATLSNTISIRNNVVTIPEMNIRSSAIDINVSGTHSFDNQIRYSMDFALSEILTLKDRKEDYNEYVARDQSGKTRIYLTMIGTTDDYEVELERTNVKSTIAEEMNNEKNEVKQLLKEEFGGAESNNSETSSETIQIEFDPEGTKPDPSKENTEEKEPKEGGGIFDRLKKKSSKEKNKLKDGNFEDDDF